MGWHVTSKKEEKNNIVLVMEICFLLYVVLFCKAITVTNECNYIYINHLTHNMFINRN